MPVRAQGTCHGRSTRPSGMLKVLFGSPPPVDTGRRVLQGALIAITLGEPRLDASVDG